MTLPDFKIKDNFCIILVKIWRKLVNWFRRYSKINIVIGDLGSEQREVKRNTTALGAFKIKNNFCIIMLKIWCKSVYLVQEIWQKQFCICSGQIAVKEGRECLSFRLRL